MLPLLLPHQPPHESWQADAPDWMLQMGLASAKGAVKPGGHASGGGGDGDGGGDIYTPRCIHAEGAVESSTTSQRPKRAQQGVWRCAALERRRESIFADLPLASPRGQGATVWGRAVTSAVLFMARYSTATVRWR